MLKENTLEDMSMFFTKKVRLALPRDIEGYFILKILKLGPSVLNVVLIYHT